MEVPPQLLLPDAVAGLMPMPPPQQHDEKELAGLLRANMELLRHLEEKDAEIASLRERLVALERGSAAAPSPLHLNDEQATQSSPLPPPSSACDPNHIGDYHAIGSRSLPLLSAAHVARLSTMSNNNGGGVPSPSSARQQQQPPPPPPGVGSSSGSGTSGGSATTNPPPEPVHQTDTASIRRRYMALEKGEGAKPDLFLLGSVGADALFFQSNLALEFDEDSPSFRRRLRAMDENVEGMRSHLQRLVAIVQRYIEAGLAFAGVGRSFASELMHLEAESWFTRLGGLAPALVRFGETIDEIQNINEAVLASLEATFLAPMREFVKRELKEVKELKEAVHRSHEDYLAQLKQYLALKRGAPGAVVRLRTQELMAVRRRFELGRYDLVNTLNQLETKKKHTLVERVVCALYAYLGFFHQGHTELAAMEPGMRELQHQLRLSRRAFAQQARIAEAKRMQLELLLSSKLTNISGIKAQLALDDWASLFDETGLPATASPPPFPAPQQQGQGQQDEAALGITPNPEAEAEVGEEDGADAPTISRASSLSTASTAAPSSPALIPSVPVQPSHRPRHSSSASASSILSYSLPTTAAAAPTTSPSSPPTLAMGGGRDSRSWSASFSSMAMSPIDNRPRAATGASAASSVAPGAGPGASGFATTNSVICESGLGGPPGKEAGTVLPFLQSPAWRGPDAAGATTTTAPPLVSSTRAPVTSGACVKQGYLWKRSSNVRKDWKRRFFFIRNGKLSYQREDDPVGPPRADICDLLLSTVRECLKDSDSHWTFEILSPGKRPYMLQAENEEEYHAWVHALRSQTEALLGLGLTASAANTNSLAGGLGVSPPTSPHRGSSGASGGGGWGPATHAAFVDRVRRANPCCADCGDPGADWAVINAGVVICIQCSGIHRSLGVHVSKVRSLTLDRWPRALRLLMDGVGNDRFNAVWEAAVPPGRGKPPGHVAAREEREAWIRDKYLGRAFVAQGEPVGEEGEEDPDVILYNSARRGDVGGLLWALAHGADVNWAHPGRRGRTAAHAVCEGAAAVGGGGGTAQSRMVCLELLHQNGGSLEAVDEDEMSPLDVAMDGPAAPSPAPAPGGMGEKEGSGLVASGSAFSHNQLSVQSVGSCGNMGIVSYLLAKIDK